jgi:hypothetical protein
MVAIRINTILGDNRKLVIQLPEDVSPGEIDVELNVHSTEDDVTRLSSVNNPAREAARAKLLAAGALVTRFEVPENAARLSIEERMRIGKMPPDARSSLDLINEDRGEY